MIESIIESIEFFKDGGYSVIVKEDIPNCTDEQYEAYTKDVQEGRDEWKKNPRDFIYYPK